MHVAGRLEHLLHAGDAALVELGPTVAVMRAHRLPHRLEHLVVDRHRPRNHQELAIAHASTSRATRYPDLIAPSMPPGPTRLSVCSPAKKTRPSRGAAIRGSTVSR